MKKIYTIATIAALTALTTLNACKKSENENPENQGTRPKITVTTAEFADTDLLAEKSPSTTQIAGANSNPPPAGAGGVPAAGGVSGSNQLQGEAGQIGEITRLATKTITTPTHSTEEFRAGDQIGIYVHSAPTAEQGELNHTTNTPYITDDGTSWRPVYLLGGAFTAPKYYITAYYPYAEALVDALTVPHTVATDQSDAPTDATTVGKLELSNFLIARGATLENATTTPSAQLNFAHAMALFEIKIHLPIMVEGRELDSLETMLIKGTETRASINLATGGVTVQSASAATIKPRRVSGNGRPGILSIFEAIVVPQNIAEGAELLEIRCRMKDGSIESFDYSIPKQNWMAFKSGHRTSITLMPTAEVSFMGELPLLIDGLAHSAMALPIFVAKDLTWDLSVDNIPWMTISATEGGVYGKKLSGSSTTGAMVNVYVKVDANSSQVMPRSGEMILRGYRTGGSEVAPAVYLAVQNYYNFAGAGSTWTAAAGEGSSPVAPFVANQTWTAASVDDWVKIAGSATYGDGSPTATYSHVGSLLAGQLFLQADANNSAAARSTTVKFSSDYVDGTNFSYTVNQAAPEVVLVPAAAVAVTKDAGVDADLFTVTAPAGVKWKVLSASGAIGGLTLSVATGVEQVGTGEAVSVKGSYSANLGTASLSSDVVVAFAAMGADQQKTVKVTQSAAGPEFIEINGLRWATGNLVADGANGAKAGAPEDGGLYFQFGSLLGWKGGASGDGTGRSNKTNGQFYVGSSFNAASEVAVFPAVAAATIAAIGTTFPNQSQNLYYFGYTTAPYSTAGQSLRAFTGYATGTLAASGVGDPCTYYLGSPWRQPTNLDWQALYSASTSTTYPGTWANGNTTSYLQMVVGGKTMHIPASGRRITDGSIANVGQDGYCWSESVVNADNGYSLGFGSGSVYPQNNNSRRFGMTVRCVQDVPVEPTVPTPPTADQVVTINGLKWTTGNLVASGRQNAKVGAPTDGGLYFQFGSLLGWKGGASGDGTGVCTKTNNTFFGGATFNAASEIALYPSVAIATIAAIGTTWPNQSANLYYFGLNTYATTYAKLRDFAGFATGALVDKGVGDPCRYYLGGDWRLPTAEEYKALCNNYAGGSDLGSANAAWQDSPAGMNFNNNSTKLFIPTSGFRGGNNGAFSNIGTNGYYWSESAASGTHGYALYFNDRLINSQDNTNRRGGFSVRCVQDMPTEPTPPTADQIITINGLKWTTGNLVANGATNAKVGEATDYGLYFQFGSLVGWSGGADGSGVGTGQPALAVNVNPTAYTGTTVYTTCGYYSAGTSGTIPSTDVAATGIGDPCRFYLGSPWRLPTMAEFTSMCNGYTGGSAFASANAAWQATPPGMNFNNNSTKLFIPASGLRSTDGSFYGVGTYGYYWSESVNNADGGYHLHFHSGSVSPQNSRNRRHGFPVRCVQ